MAGFAQAIPEDLSGRTVLDIGCNAGYYSLEMKRRGAERVVGIDFDERYLAQARLAAEVRGMEIEWRKLSVYEVGQLHEQFDLVIFMGVFYHLRHPLLALDLIHRYAARDLLLFQSMQRGSPQAATVAEDYPFAETGLFEQPDFPGSPSSSESMRATRQTGGCQTEPARKPCCAAPALKS